VPVQRYKILIFAFAGLLIALAGVLNAFRLGAGSATVGRGMLFQAASAVVVGGTAITGGVGGMLNTLVGVLFITVLNNAVVLLASTLRPTGSPGRGHRRRRDAHTGPVQDSSYEVSVSQLGRPLRLDIAAPVLAPIALVVAFALLNDRFVSTVNLQNIGQDGSILLVLALGLTYVILMGAIDLSLGAMLGLGEVVTATLVSHIGYWAFVVAVLVGLIAGLINGAVHVRLRIPSFHRHAGHERHLADRGAGRNPRREHQRAAARLALPGVGPGDALRIPTTVFLAALCSRWRSPRAAHALRALHVRHRRGRGSRARIRRTDRRFKILAFGLSGAAATGAGALFSARLLGGSPIAGDRLPATGDRGRSRGRDGAHRRDRRHRADGTRRPGHDPDGQRMSILGVDPFVQQVVTGAIVIAAVVATMDRSRLFVTK